MRNLISSLMVGLALFVFAACSGSSSYSEATCKTLIEKVQDNQELSESEINTMIDQTSAILKVIQEKENSIGDDTAKREAYLKSDEANEMLGNFMVFVMYLGQNEKNLSADNQKKLEELEKEFDSLK